MNIYIDTSSLFKLYHEEKDSDKIISFLDKQENYIIYISAITRIEFLSTLYKKLRTKEIQSSHADILKESFNSDLRSFQIGSIDHLTVDLSCELLSKYVNNGLRSLDALQLACAVSARSTIDIAVTSDILLENFLGKENIKTLN